VGDSVSTTRISVSNATLFEPTRFIGRLRDLQRLERRFADERLVTIAAGAGYGKTRLALRFGVSRASSFEGGVWFVDLRSATDVEAVCVRISRVLGISAEGNFTGDAAAYAIGRALASLGPALVILDNAEHLSSRLGDAVVAWLGAAPELRLLITSRSPLGVFGEDVFDLLPLDGGGEDALQLFLDRVRANRADYRPDQAEKRRIATHLQVAGGVPLAVELFAAAAAAAAAASTAVVAPNAPSDSGVWSTDPIAWGFARLSPILREVLVQCSVFRGRFGHEAANAVISLSSQGGETPSVLLARLVDQCLVQEDDSGSMWLCEGVRGHAEACLDARPDAGTVRWRHAHHYAAIADAAVDDAGARALLEAERDELEAAQELAAGERRSDLVLRFCFALDLLSTGSGLTSRQLGVLDAALQRAPSDPGMVGRALGIRAGALRGLGRLEEAAKDAEVALSLARQNRDRRQVAAMLVAVGMAKFQLGDLDAALERYEQALDHARVLDDAQLEGASLQQLGAVKQSMGDAGAAQLYYSEALDLAVDRDDEAGEMRASAGLGSFYLELGAHDRASEFYQRALLLADRLGAHRTARIVLGYLGVLYFDNFALFDAEALLRRAAERSRAVGDIRVEGIFEGIHGGVLASMGRVDDALRSLDLAERLLAASPFFRTVVEIHRGHLDLALARELRLRADHDGARAYAERARARIRDARRGELPLSARSDDARIAVRILERAIERDSSDRR